jgi:hypothetical protein
MGNCAAHGLNPPKPVFPNLWVAIPMEITNCIPRGCKKVSGLKEKCNICKHIYSNNSNDKSLKGNKYYIYKRPGLLIT